MSCVTELIQNVTQKKHHRGVAQLEKGILK